jgi:hypothetical protein
MDYSDDFNSWEPHEELKDNEQLAIYEQNLDNRTRDANDDHTEVFLADADDTEAMLTSLNLPFLQFEPSSYALLAHPVSSDPLTVAAALKREDAAYWQRAIDDELDSLKKNDTWELTTLPAGKKAIGSKWVFKTKLNTDGTIDRYKARLVAKGFNQRPGIDYDETFAPVAKFNSIRVILALAAKLDLEIHQLDIKTAFLNGDLDEEIYMKLPDGLTSKPGIVCKLKKTLYGLKQSPRMWFKKFDAFLTGIGFIPSTADVCIYHRKRMDSIDLFGLYVDDGILAGTLDSITNVSKEVACRFDMQNCGPIQLIVGLKVTRDRAQGTLSINQSHLCLQVLERFNMGECSSVTTPMQPNQHLLPLPKDDAIPTFDRSDPANVPCDVTSYQRIVGSLMYLMTGTRPDLAFSVSILSQFNARPSQAHYNAAIRVLRYLRGTHDYGLTYRSTQYSPNNDKVILYGYSDADWANDVTSRRSVTGYVFYCCGGVISWSAKRQPTTALSSTEAEYMALTQATKEAIWLRRLLLELGFPQQITTIFEDNQSTIALAKNPVHHQRTKHIDVRHHFVREQVEIGSIQLEYIPTTDMIADALTKALPRPKLAGFVAQMNLGRH